MGGNDDLLSQMDKNMDMYIEYSTIEHMCDAYKIYRTSTIIHIAF